MYQKPSLNRIKSPQHRTIQIPKLEGLSRIDNSQAVRNRSSLVEELQNLLAQVFSLENQIKVISKEGGDTKQALGLILTLREKLQEIEAQLYRQPSHKKSRSCYSNTSSPISTERLNPSIQPLRSTQITLRETESDQLKIPAISIQLKQELPEIIVTNPREILESLDANPNIVQCKTDDTMRKRQQYSCYNLSFSGHPLQDPIFAQVSCIENQLQSNFTQSLFNNTNSNQTNDSEENCLRSISPKNMKELIESTGMLIYVSCNRPQQRLYDPVQDVAENPKTFGYELLRIKYDGQKLVFLRQSNHLDTNKENIGSFFYQVAALSHIHGFQLVKIIQQLQGLQTEKAMRFKKIYQDIRCNESTALKHLKIKFFPFVIRGDSTVLNCLASSYDDLMMLQEFFNKIIR